MARTFVRKIFFQTFLFIITLSGFLALTPSTLWARSEFSRFLELTDKLKTVESFHPFERSLLVDFTGTMSDDLLNVISDGKSATRGGVSEITSFLQTYLGTEHFASLQGRANIPLPSIYLWKWKFSPELSLHYDLQASLSITEQPDPFILSLGGFTVTSTNPLLQAYAKEDLKMGLGLHIQKRKRQKHFFYSKNFIYTLRRWDRYEGIDANSILEQGEIIDIDKARNTRHSLNLDTTLGYKTGNSHFFIKVEDLLLKTISDRRNEIGPLVHGERPLIRLQAQHSFPLLLLRATPFVGLTKRTSYDFDKGLYGGLDIQLAIIPLSMVSIIDTEYLTISPRFYFWFFQIEYTSKTPLQQKIDGVKTAQLHSLNIRFSFF